ncbi:MAG TPA: glycosyltransferase family 4 protein [Bryobacteraceae bacterium]|mgnify:CR=1 FL=1|nr:glycosyltransferase family 4 protein [Bryobacteraceae bacterium]
MRILHLDTGREMRGGQRQVLLLMRGLRDAGVDQLLLARAGAPLLGQAADEGFQARPISLAAILRHSGAAVVHCHDGRSHTLAALASRSPIAVSRRVAFPVGRGRLDRWKYGRATVYLAVSEYAAAQLLATGVPQRKVRIVRDGILPPARLSDRTAGVLALELDDPLKGGSLLATLSTPVTLTRDLPAGLRTASVFLYLSEMEGLGSAVLLAMAHGVAVVASRVGGLPEIVRHGETGFCVGNGREEIDDALRALLDDPARARAMGERGREWVISECHADQTVRRTLEIYKELAH